MLAAGVLFFSVGVATAADRLPIELGRALWQALPAGVQRVYVGPDGRTWFQCRVEGDDRSPADVRRQIEHEFAQPAPQIAGAEILLLEPGGRVWFFAGDGQTILGYDGHQWIDYKLEDPADSLAGRCLTRGGWECGDAHRAAGATAWFLGRHAVYCYDGRRFTHRSLPRDVVAREVPVKLAVSPDGRTAAVYDNRGRKVLVSRDGQWSERPLPTARAHGAVTAMAVSDKQTLWYLFADGQLRTVTLRSDDRPPAEVVRLVAALGDNDFQTREKATQRLEAMGTAAAAWLEATLADCDDPERRSRLRQVVFAVRHAEATQGLPVGTLRIAGVHQLFADDRGRLLLLADRIAEERSVRKGYVVLEDDGARHAIFGPAAASDDAARSWYQPEAAPPLGPTAGQAWLTPYRMPGQPGLYDLVEGKLLAPLPHKEFRWLHAAAGEGRIFVSTAPPPRSASILAYSPAARGLDPPLAAERIEIEHPNFAIADDGAVWCVTSQDGLCRFDGREWTPASKTHLKPNILLPGAGDTLLAVTGSDAILYRGTTPAATGPLTTLIEQNPNAVAHAFGSRANAGRACINHFSTWNLVADRSGAIWHLAAPGKLAVLAGKKWLDAAAALNHAAKRPMRVEFLALAGGGDRVYVSNAGSFATGQAFYGQVRGEELQFTPAPNAMQRDEIRLLVRDAQDALWMPGFYGQVKDERERIEGQIVYRLKSDGSADELKDSGFPRLADAAGDVWLGAVWNKPGELFQIWRGGRIVGQVTVPTADARSVLFSDRPGSVYAWGTAGLQHLSADTTARAATATYRLDRLQMVEGLEGRLLARGYSRLGYAVGATLVESPNRGHYLNLIRLSGGDAKTRP